MSYNYYHFKTNFLPPHNGNEMTEAEKYIKHLKAAKSSKLVC